MTTKTTNPFADLADFGAIQTESKAQTQDNETEELKQKSIEWFLARWGKFTGSKIPNLMKSGRGKGELWGETSKNVILEIASYQRMTDEGRVQYAVEQMYKDFRQTRWGNTYEPEAREAYAKHTGYVVKETGFTVHPTISYMGGSFDGEAIGYNNESTAWENNRGLTDLTVGLKGIIEIKCPYDPVKHQQNYDLKLAGGITADHEFYGQIQNNIEVAGVDWCDFISYDPRCQDEYKLVVIRVLRDQLFIDAILTRVHKAKFALDMYIEGIPLTAALVGAEQIDINEWIKANGK